MAALFPSCLCHAKMIPFLIRSRTSFFLLETLGSFLCLSVGLFHSPCWTLSRPSNLQMCAQEFGAIIFLLACASLVSLISFQNSYDLDVSIGNLLMAVFTLGWASWDLPWSSWDCPEKAPPTAMGKPSGQCLGAKAGEGHQVWQHSGCQMPLVPSFSFVLLFIVLMTPI